MKPQKIPILDQPFIIEEVFTSHKKFITTTIILHRKNAIIQSSPTYSGAAGCHQSSHPKSTTTLLVFFHGSQITIRQFSKQMTHFIQWMATGINPHNLFLLLKLVHQLPWFCLGRSEERRVGRESMSGSAAAQVCKREDM